MFLPAAAYHDVEGGALSLSRLAPLLLPLPGCGCSCFRCHCFLRCCACCSCCTPAEYCRVPLASRVSVDSSKQTSTTVDTTSATTKLERPQRPLIAAHYLAILEMTTARKWTHSSGGLRGREGLLERLEKRLAISLDRAHSQDLVREKNILELVAVVGVVAPEPYSDSVRERMSKADALPLLKKMMDASRFVFVKIPKLRAGLP